MKRGTDLIGLVRNSGQGNIMKKLLFLPILLLTGNLLATAPMNFGSIASTSTARGTAYITGDLYGYDLRTDASSNWSIVSGIPSFSSATITNLNIDSLTVTYGVAAATGVFSGAISATTLDTGQGANELYDMDQNVETTSTPTFSSMTVTNGITANSLDATYGVAAATGVFTGNVTADTLTGTNGLSTTYGVSAATGVFSGEVTASTFTASQNITSDYGIDCSTFSMSNGAADGYILQSDASGSGTWISSTPFIVNTASNTVEIAKTGKTYSTIQSALDTNAIDGTLFLVYTGDYANDTVNLTANNQCIKGTGCSPKSVYVSNVSTISNFGTFTGGVVENIKMVMALPDDETATTVTGSGSCNYKFVHAEAIAGGTIGAGTGATVYSGTGKVKIVEGKVVYTNTADRGARGKKAILVEAGSDYTIDDVDFEITGSGTSGKIAAIRSASTGKFTVDKCDIDVEDNDTTTAIGIDADEAEGSPEVLFNTFHIVNSVGNATCVRVGSDGTALNLRSSYNHYHAEAGGNAYSFDIIDSTVTVTSQLDDVIAADGVNNAGGTYTQLNSESDGALTASGDITAANLITDSYNVDTQFALVATDTTTLQSNIGTEESARISADTAIGVTTGTLETNKLAKTATFGGDVSGTYDALQVDSAKGIEFATSTWTTTEYLVLSGTSIITGTPAGVGDVIEAGDNDFTGTNTHAGLETFDDIATSDDSLYKLIYSTTVGTDSTSISITGLLGNTDKTYIVRTRIYNGTGGTIGYDGTINADTGTNYGNRNTVAAGVDGTNVYTNSVVNATSIRYGFGYATASESCFAEMIISADTWASEVRTGMSITASDVAGEVIARITRFVFVWNNTSDEITSIQITATGASGIGVGSKIELWARR